jgi:integrase
LPGQPLQQPGELQTKRTLGRGYEPTGQARLSYRRAAELFTEATDGATLHQLRHSALTHAAEDGANTSTLLAYSGHTSVASLARYARVSPEALSRWQHHRDPASPPPLTGCTPRLPCQPTRSPRALAVSRHARR